MYFFIISFGFLMAMRGARPAPLQKPGEGLRRLVRETADFFITVSSVLTLWAFVTAFERIQAGVWPCAILGSGIAAYLFTRYQKKTDVFFLSVISSVFWISSRQPDLLRGILGAGVVSAGIAFFQACFLGLRYKLLFSNVPASAQGWPLLCFLAGFISIVLWGFRGLVF